VLYLKDIREALQMTQAEIAEALEVSKSYYEKLERGAVPVTRKIIEKIKKIYPKVNINLFF
jgi:transcriptional regulator with XRE-family HTH domain